MRGMRSKSETSPHPAVIDRLTQAFFQFSASKVRLLVQLKEARSKLDV